MESQDGYNLTWMPFDREQLKLKAAILAPHGVLIGMSSWKYPRWRGMIYDESRYITREKFSESRFERDCPAEYAETFKTVCVDGAYYRFPEHRYLDVMVLLPPGIFFVIGSFMVAESPRWL